MAVRLAKVIGREPSFIMDASVDQIREAVESAVNGNPTAPD